MGFYPEGNWYFVGFYPKGNWYFVGFYPEGNWSFVGFYPRKNCCRRAACVVKDEEHGNSLGSVPAHTC